MSDIIVRGAREHNLDNVNLRLPRNRFICFTGVSGSGKSSFAFDTLYAEGQRRYVESLSSYARQFLGRLPKPDADQISGLSPAISISQKTGGQSARSTVGTITEISDYLRVLFARVATGYCPRCGRQIVAQTRSQIIERLRSIPSGVFLQILAPIVRDQKGRCAEIINNLRKKGFRKLRIDGIFLSVDDEIDLDRKVKHSIDAVVDRVERSDANYRLLAEAVDSALQIGKGRLIVLLDSRDKIALEGDELKPANDEVFSNAIETRLNGTIGTPVDTLSDRANEGSVADENYFPAISDLGSELYFSADYACSHCGISFERPSPQLFSFNHSRGMCPHCQGLGSSRTFDPRLLIPDETKSFKEGCIVPVGRWDELGRWRQHIYQGVAGALEKLYDLKVNSVLETPWKDLDQKVKQRLLWGTGDLKIVFSWSDGALGHKWGGTFEGVIPKMLKQYQETSNKMQLTAMERYMNLIPCGYCQGRRLNERACSFRIETKSRAPVFDRKKSFSLPDLYELPIVDLLEFFSDLNLTDSGRAISRELIKEICVRLGFLRDVGLSYLSLGRSAPSLSGGEMQRIRLAGQVGGGLVGVMYVLDEPSIGLHPSDNEKLIETLSKLRDLGNSVLVVEHDEDTMLASDYLVDFGPGPGVHGGRVIASGTVPDVVSNQRRHSATAKFLAGEESIEIPKTRKKPDDRWLIVRGVTHHNLKNIDVRIPLGGLVCVTGVSGSGKSSFVNDVLKEILARDLNRANGSPGAYESIEGVECLNKLISIDQAPIGRTPRSNPATYIKLFDDVRKLYSETPDARAKGYAPGRFSFNVSGGRCEACEGNGSTRLEMDFLADVWTTCPVCGGRRFNRETTSIKYKGLSIDQVLDLDVESALKHFENVPKIREKLQTLFDVGLGYMNLGQPSPTLSGGEAQRVKLARELTKKSSGKTIYLLDEPTTGLHFADIRTLLKILRSFADSGNTVLVVEHNLDVIKTADLGPVGGAAGGRIVAEGTPEQIANNPNSRTGAALKEFMKRNRKVLARRLAKKASPLTDEAFSSDVTEPISIRGACEHNLQNVSVDIPRDKITVCCGPSGSGKSSLAIDVAYAEGRRRYVESLSSYARQFLGQFQKPNVEKVTGISPSIAIEQKSAGRSPRSTVGTVTEILDYLRVVFARLGTPYCPDCDLPIGTLSIDEIVARIAMMGDSSKVLLTAPLTMEKGESFDKLWDRLRVQGFSRVRVDGTMFSLDNSPKSRRKLPEIEVVVDRFVLNQGSNAKRKSSETSRITDSVETALEWGKGTIRLVVVDEEKPERDWQVLTLSQKMACEKCGRTFEVLTPRHFSFNSPLGWCPHCEGLGVRSGANPTTFIRDPKLSLGEGALSIWRNFENPTSRAMLIAFSRETGVPLDVPFERLDARFRRVIFNGLDEKWIDVHKNDLEFSASADSPSKLAKGAFELWDAEPSSVVFQFQFKGIYPAAEEAGRSAPFYRSRLEYQVAEQECSACLGSRLRDDVSAVRFHNLTMDQICRTPLSELLRFFEDLSLTPLEKKVAGELIDEIIARLRFLLDVGLDYLTLSRPAPSLSGGEAQRIRLAAQIGGGLVGALYVLDEPTIGLHQRDNRRLISAIRKLRDLGNTVVIVEHDQEVIENADFVLDFGPGAGAKGGSVVASGTPERVKLDSNSPTGAYLSGEKSIPIPLNRRIMI